MSDSTDNCTSITPECPIEETVYGYYPSLGANGWGAGFFGLCLLLNLYLGWRFKTWTYMVAMSLACFTSCIGYIGRIIMNDNPWNENGFMLQIITLTFSPAFNSAAIYLILKHVVITFSASFSRIPPRFYPWGFISADILALILQSAGGGIAASTDSHSMREVGDGLMIAGVVFQVVTLAAFGAMISDYAIRRWRGRAAEPFSQQASAVWTDVKFRVFAVSLVVLYTAILIRCVYRIAELAGGWESAIMQSEPLFIALDTIMMTICTGLQTFVHPGIFFPAMAENLSTAKAPSGKGEMYHLSSAPATPPEYGAYREGERGGEAGVGRAS